MANSPSSRTFTMRRAMRAVIFYKREAIPYRVEDLSTGRVPDIVILIELSFGMRIMTTTEAAYDLLYSLKGWTEAELSQPVSQFLFPTLTKEELVELLRERVPGIEIIDPREPIAAPEEAQKARDC